MTTPTFPNNNTGYCLETDIEPDDLWALYNYTKAGINFHHVVVGESSAKVKVQRIHEYFKLLKAEFGCVIPKIVVGMDSNKYFPDDGKEFQTMEPYENIKVFSYDDTLREFVRKFEDPVMVIIKPCRELMTFHKNKLTELKEILKNVRAYFYGSFNLRSVFRFGHDKIADMLKMFKECCIYESFFASNTGNSVDENDTELFNSMTKNRNKSKYMATVSKASELWLQFKLDEFKQNVGDKLKEHKVSTTADQLFEILNNVSTSNIDYATLCTNEIQKVIPSANARDTSMIYRMYKAYKNVNGFKKFQCVMADMCLSVVMIFASKYDKYVKKGLIAFEPEKALTLFTPLEISTTAIYAEIPRKELITDLIKLLD